MQSLIEAFALVAVCCAPVIWAVSEWRLSLKLAAGLAICAGFAAIIIDETWLHIPKHHHSAPQIARAAQ